MRPAGDSEPERPTSGHRLLPHTADLIIEAWGEDEAACAEEAARGLIEACVSGPAGESDWVSVIHAGPPGDLLRLALDEVVFVLDTSDDVPVGASLLEVGDGYELRLPLAPRTEVRMTGAAAKAIVIMEFDARSGPSLVRCRVLVDV